MRPTGLLHLGNYVGALQNWVDLQQDYDCIYCAVDVHALTTVESRSDTEVIRSNIDDMVLDWLAAGIDPERSLIFVQSHVPGGHDPAHPPQHGHALGLADARAHL